MFEFLSSPDQVKGEVIALDIETTGLDIFKDSIVGFSVCNSNDVAYYSQDLSLLPEILKNRRSIIFHNAVFDVSFLKQKGYSIEAEIHDTLILAHLLDADRDSLKLKDLAQRYFGQEAIKGAITLYQWLKDNNLTKEHIFQAPKEMLKDYAAEDALNTWKLAYHFSAKIQGYVDLCKGLKLPKSPRDMYVEEEQKMIPVLVGMKLRGIRLDIPAVISKRSELEEQITKLQFELNQTAREDTFKAEEILTTIKNDARLAKSKTGKFKKPTPRQIFNWGSTKHLKVLVIDILKCKISKKTIKGEVSLDEEVLEELSKQHPMFTTLLSIRKYQKLLKTYVDGLLDKQKLGIIHANYNIAGTATGRFSCNEPNLQNLPKTGGIKQLFIPREGCVFAKADYSQLELRIAAHYSEDELLLKAYRENLDLHRLTASIIFNKKPEEITDEERALGKTTNFAIIYKAGGYRIAEILGYFEGIDRDNKFARMQQIMRGEEIANQLFSQYKGLAEFSKKQEKFFYINGFAITEFGRMRFLKGINDLDRGTASHWLKAGFNQPIQGFGASLCKRAMIALHNEGFNILLQTHDDIVCEIPLENKEKYLDKMQKIMENVATLKVPLKVEINLMKNLEDKYVE